MEWKGRTAQARALDDTFPASHCATAPEKTRTTQADKLPSQQNDTVTWYCETVQRLRSWKRAWQAPKRLPKSEVSTTLRTSP
jgi:hypothetical protein